MMTPRALGRVALGGVLLALAASAPAAATGIRTAVGPTTAATTAPARKGSPRPAVDRVADVYGAYVDALCDSGRGRPTPCAPTG